MPAPWLTEAPQHWDSYLPQADDYDDTQAYIDALAAGSDVGNQSLGGYVNPGTGEQIGGRQTEQEHAVRKFNWHFNNAVRSGDMSQLRGLISHNPDMAMAAYHAFDEYGNPLIDPAALAMIERMMGLGPNTPPASVAPDLPDAGLPPDDRPLEPRPVQGGAVDSGIDPRAIQGGVVDPRLGMDPRVGGQVIPDQPVYLDPVLDAPVNAAPPVEQPGYDPYNPPGSDPNAPPYMEPPYVNPGPQGAGSGVVIGGVEIPMTTIERIRRKYGRDMRPSGLGPY